MVPMHWTANVINNPEEKQSFETYLTNNERLLKRLAEIISEKQIPLLAKEFSLSSYKDAGWAYEQAHINGRMAALEEIKQLCNLQG